MNRREFISKSLKGTSLFAVSVLFGIGILKRPKLKDMKNFGINYKIRETTKLGDKWRRYDYGSPFPVPNAWRVYTVNNNCGTINIGIVNIESVECKDITEIEKANIKILNNESYIPQVGDIVKIEMGGKT